NYATKPVAGNVTVRWTGKVPIADCVSTPISNQIEFNSQSVQCKTELKWNEKKTHTNKTHNIVSFDM
ncbi:hypothetical protein AB4279_07810, partial [Vibrio cyclitrophicus]